MSQEKSKCKHFNAVVERSSGYLGFRCSDCGQWFHESTYLDIMKEAKLNRFQMALDVQDAVNLTAVVGQFHQVCLQVLHETENTGAVCKDPAVLLFAEKINDLCGITFEDNDYNLRKLSMASFECGKLSERFKEEINGTKQSA